MKAHTGLSSLSGLVTFSPSDVPQAEADALIWLFHATSGPSWTDNTGWLIDPVVGNWFGVTVAGGHVTQIDLTANAATVNGDIAAFPWSQLSSLTHLRLYNTSVSGDISGWTLPASLVTLYLYNASVSGDISGWTLPASLENLYLHTTNVSGDISGWTLPAGLLQLLLDTTNVSGDISGWTLNASLIVLYLHDTNVSGDISGWTLPAGLRYLYLYNTSVSGDISGWTLNASLRYLYLYNTSLSNAPDISVNTNMRQYYYEDCGLVQADVDAVLLSVYNRRAAFAYDWPTLNVGGTNAAPSGTYQDGDPPTTGKEYAFEIVNDPEAEGFNKWAVTFTA